MSAPHLSTRAASANHTERGAPRHEPFRYIYEERGTPDLAPGDSVIVIDPHSSYFEKTGVVDTVLTAKKYLIKFNWGACAIHPFKRSQLAKIERKGAPTCALMVIDMPIAKPASSRKRPDVFFCIWGRYDTDKCPEIPRRFMEHKTRQMKKKPITQPVICLPAVCDSTRKEQAHVKYLKFRGLLRLIADLDELPIAAPVVESGTSWLDMIDQQEYEKEARKAAMPSKSPKTSQNSRIKRAKAKTYAQSPKRQKSPKVVDFPQLRIRRYA